MARQPRFILPGYPQHIIQRGNNRNLIFTNDADRLFYLDKLDAACIEFDCSIHAYVLMSNHVHLLITPGMDAGIGKVMQSLGRCYVRYFNWRHQRTGTLWEGRYRASLVETERYLLACYRYIELNPVRAGIVDHPQHYRWSSYGYNARGFGDRLLTPHSLYLQLGSDGPTRRAAYRKLFEDVLSTKTLDSIRQATNGDWVMGDISFRRKVEARIQRQGGPRSRGGDRKSACFRAQQKSIESDPIE